MRPSAIALAIAFGACTRGSDAPAPPSSLDARAAAPPDAKPPPDPLTCHRAMQGVFGALHGDMVAEAPDRAKTLAAWRAITPACRRGAWYQAAAILLRVEHVDAVEADGERFTSARDALARGLAVDGGDPGLLAYVAYVAAIDPASAPALPADACDRAKAAPVPADAGWRADVDEQAAYVCGHAQLAAGAFADAASTFGAIEEPPYPDVLLRRVQAMLGAKDARGAGKLVRWAKDQLTRYAQLVGVASSDPAALAAQLAKVAAAK